MVNKLIMKKSLFFLMILCTINSNAQVYLISFAGTGASATVSSVKVENLTAGTSLTLSGGNVLRLNIFTGIDPVKNTLPSQLKIYPNPTTGNSVLQVYPPAEGNADIKVFDLTGREVAQLRSYLENSLQEFRLSGLQSGFYTISVLGNSYSLSGKLISNGKPSGHISIGKISSNPAAEEKASKNRITKEVQDYIDMPYSIGDRIKFTGTSGNYSTVKMDIPTSDKTITFNFVSCTDGDNINYPVVEIGNQVWMAENLKTTKYRNGDLIGTTTPPTLNISDEINPKYQWAYDGNETNVATYGRLYTWYTVNDSRKICPSAWHVSTDDEWITMTNYLESIGYGSFCCGRVKAISIAANTGWIFSSVAGTPGNDPHSNNLTGFTALPGGYRDNFGGFNLIGSLVDWWTATEYNSDYAWMREMNNGMYIIGNPLNERKIRGFSVRCIKDN